MAKDFKVEAASSRESVLSDRLHRGCLCWRGSLRLWFFGRSA
jgi:hypothetical protein